MECPFNVLEQNQFCSELIRLWRELIFRYLRFFPDGQVMMLTTPEDPLVTVPRLRSNNSRYPFSELNLSESTFLGHVPSLSRSWSSMSTGWIPSCLAIIGCPRIRTIKPKFMLLSPREKKRWVCRCKFMACFLEQRCSISLLFYEQWSSCDLSAEDGRVPEESVLQAEPSPRSRAHLPCRTAAGLRGATALQQAGVDPPFLPHHLQVSLQHIWQD